MNLYNRYIMGERNFYENEWLQIVKLDGYAIKDVENPSKEIQLAAMKEYSYAIRYIKNPSEELQLIAVKRNGYAIKYIENPSKAVQLEAVKQNRMAITYIKKSSVAVQLEAIKTINDIYYINNYITNKKAKQKWSQIQQMKKACL